MGSFRVRRKLDKELLWNLQLLSEVTRVDGEQLLKYRGELERVLSVCVRLRCKRAYALACSLLEHLLRSLSHIYPTEYRSTAGGFHAQLPIRDWGRAGDLAALDVRWHVPGPEEQDWVFQLLSRLLQPELEHIQAHASGGQPMSREELLQSLAVVQHCMLGAGSLLPPLEGAPVPDLVSSLVDLGETKLHIGVEYDGCRDDHRASICRSMRLLLRHVLEHSEDDTKSLFVIIQILSDVLFFRGIHRREFDSRWRSFTLVKKSLENRVSLDAGPAWTGVDEDSPACPAAPREEAAHPRSPHRPRAAAARDAEAGGGGVRIQGGAPGAAGGPAAALHQHLQPGGSPNQSHQSHQSVPTSQHLWLQVRSRAQTLLASALATFSFAYRDVVPRILQLLSPQHADGTQHQFKGALYCLLALHGSPLHAGGRDWDCVGQVWPALVRCGLSPVVSLDKPSLAHLLDDIIDRIHRQHHTVGIYFTVSGAAPSGNTRSWSTTCWTVWRTESCRSTAGPGHVTTLTCPTCLSSSLLFQALEVRVHGCRPTGAAAARRPPAAPRRRALLHPEPHARLHPHTQGVCVRVCVHVCVCVRVCVCVCVCVGGGGGGQEQGGNRFFNQQVAILAMGAILKQQKRPLKKGEVKPSKISEPGEHTHRAHTCADVSVRESCCWLSSRRRPGRGRCDCGRPPGQPLAAVRQQPAAAEPRSLEEADVRGEDPPGLQPLAPTTAAPLTESRRSDLRRHEARRWSLSSSQTGSSWSSCWLFCVWRRGRAETPSTLAASASSRSRLLPSDWLGGGAQLNWLPSDWQGLFRNYGDAFLPLLWPHLERLADSPQESWQRCVCEITAGLIRGSKLWSFSKVDRLWKGLCPLIRRALSNITMETYTDWGTCIATACVRNLDQLLSVLPW
ncbi:unnamed protein product [Tetraodon nigroviridis]|uniref:(spotted green pufferfish) hypothetical protein n=1 Tax=Tetraodon nigroviridis TaxID=99883 RepID=Q4T988_TETNG|nr:unnamed protein product [Tetraodon nigroviridis]